ncbi:MAG: phage major tail tube protein [Clostridia bacterium]|nr:phage major tail tube protein [Clostridia bacterium]
MPKKVYNNVVGHRVVDNSRVAEDVTSVGIPTIEHPTTTVASSGMTMDVDIPNMAHVNAMELSVSHNNGLNCRYLGDPGKHNLEVRVARQKYNVADGDNEYESVKFRFIAIHKSTEKGTIENGNPYGSTDKYSVLRFEEEINGEIVTVIDAMSGIIKFNGKDCISPVESLLS